MPFGEAEEGPLRALDRIIRPAGTTVLDPSKYAVARHFDEYAGLVRVSPLTRQPRIGLIAVRPEVNESYQIHRHRTRSERT